MKISGKESVDEVILLARDIEDTRAQMEGRLLHGDQVRDDTNTARHVEPEEEEEAGRLLTLPPALTLDFRAPKVEQPPKYITQTKFCGTWDVSSPVIDKLMGGA